MDADLVKRILAIPQKINDKYMDQWCPLDKEKVHNACGNPVHWPGEKNLTCPWCIYYNLRRGEVTRIEQAKVQLKEMGVFEETRPEVWFEGQALKPVVAGKRRIQKRGSLA